MQQAWKEHHVSVGVATLYHNWYGNVVTTPYRISMLPTKPYLVEIPNVHYLHVYRLELRAM